MFSRPNVYRLVIEDDGIDGRTELVMEFQSSRRSPIAVLWAEKFVNPRFDMEKGELVEAKQIKTPRKYVYGTEILQRKKPGAGLMAAYWVAEALANEAVVGREAGGLCHTVLAEWFIRGPKHLTEEIAELAPRWWQLVEVKPKGRSNA